MAQITWKDAYGADQVLTTSKFTVDFYGIPSSIVDSRTLRIYGKSSQLPDKTVEVVTARIGGIPIAQPDVLPDLADWTYTVIENAKGSVNRMLCDWKEYVVGSNTGNATRGYNRTKAVQTTYNLYGEVASVIDIEGVFPTTIPTIQPDSSGTGSVVEYAVVFKIARWNNRETILR